MDPGMISGLFSLVGAGITFMGQQSAMKAAESAANARAEIAGLQYEQQVNMYTLNSMLAHRQTMEQQRRGQNAGAIAEAARVNQGGGGQAESQGSARGGSIGSVSGQQAFNIQGIQQQFGTYSKNFGLMQQMMPFEYQEFQAQSQEAQAQGLMGMGSDIANIGKSFGQILPSFGPFAQATVGGGNAGVSSGGDLV